jgi:hypothetical protein
VWCCGIFFIVVVFFLFLREATCSKNNKCLKKKFFLAFVRYVACIFIYMIKEPRLVLLALKFINSTRTSKDILVRTNKTKFLLCYMIQQLLTKHSYE